MIFINIILKSEANSDINMQEELDLTSLLFLIFIGHDGLGNRGIHAFVYLLICVFVYLYIVYLVPKISYL